MKIEKINENQIRCTLTKEELADRQIKLSELAYGSEKAKVLFRDMIEQANYEFGFEAEDIPLMIEAIPLSGENIILQITKVEYPEELDTRFSKFSEGGNFEYDENIEDETLFPQLQGADDILGIFQSMKEKLNGNAEEISSENESASAEKEAKKKRKSLELPKNLTNIFEFTNIEEIESVAHVLGDYFVGQSDLYKNEGKNRFYLLIRKSSHTPEEFNKVCNIISEYGKYKKYTKATEAFLKEHGKLILKKNALQVLYSIAGEKENIGY